MALIQLLSQSTIQARICSHLTFEDAINLQKCICPIVLNSRFIIYREHWNLQIELIGVTKLTIRLHYYIQKFGLPSGIIVAAKSKDREALDFLLKIPLPHELYDEDEKISHLLIAVQVGILEIIQLFLDQGININHHFLGKTALIAAIEDGNLKTIQFLLEKGADINHIPPSYNNSPFISSVLYKSEHQFKVIDFLVNQGADLQRDLNTAFIRSSQRNQLPVLQHLYKISQEKQIPVSLDEALLDFPIDCFWKKNSKNYERVFNLLNYLLEKGANINAVDPDGNSVLIESCCHNITELTQFFLEKGADILRNVDGRTPLHIAALHNNYCVIKILLETGKANVNELDNQGHSAISLTTQEHVRKLLIEFGALL